MKKFFTIAGGLAWSLVALFSQPAETLDQTRFGPVPDWIIRAVGRAIVEVGSTNYPSGLGRAEVKQSITYRVVDISKDRWKEVNTGRKLVNVRTWDYETVRTNHWVNRTYFVDVLTLLQHELVEAGVNRFISAEDLTAAYLLGVKKFKALGFDIGKITNERTKLALERITMERDREMYRRPPAGPTAVSPPPLPEPLPQVAPPK